MDQVVGAGVNARWKDWSFKLEVQNHLTLRVDFISAAPYNHIDIAIICYINSIIKNLFQKLFLG